MVFKRATLKKGHCPYCEGRGYFQLMLGGSETCIYCEGKGELTLSKELTNSL
ncbi:YuiA family protein [Bacillus sp. FJAT-45350]|uniref:YuiA family protein n=1 Tax=Bacillus sp. FJAT-45350 TaxID=2011014 RepID=UPI0015CECEC8|nr:YuiA family protein [Bacillus sp. FJAT-45350]